MTQKQTHVVYKRDRLTYQITKSHTLAPTHSQLPETNKYKHDLALSLRKITGELAYSETAPCQT